ncbi:MAG: hypothetical protein SFT90_03950 [Rickettsiales bacterium]|nr:hypothetical protein [Rickettsiales bacterium]
MQKILKRAFFKVRRLEGMKAGRLKGNKPLFLHSFKPSIFQSFKPIILLISLILITSCDRVPATLRKIVNESKRADWQARANDGDVEGAYKAAKASCCGDDTQKDDAVTLSNYCLAARAWHKPSMFEIGKLYLNENTPEATVIPYDEAIAYTYFHFASGGGNPEIDWYMANLEPKLDEKEKARISAMIENFPQIPCDIKR